MIPGMVNPQDLVQAPETAKKAFAALMSALVSGCECEGCRILRAMGEDLKKDLLR